MFDKNWKAYYHDVGSLPQTEEDENPEAIDKYIESHEDEAVVALIDMRVQRVRSSFGKMS